MLGELTFLSFKIAIGLSLFYMGYVLFLSRGTELQLRRLYLVGGLLSSLLLPLMVALLGWRSQQTSGELHAMVEVFSSHLARPQSVYLDPVVVRATRVIPEGADSAATTHWLFRLYWYGVLFALGLLLLRFVLFYRKFLTCKREALKNNVQVVYLQEKIAPFSFYRIVFVNPDMYTPQAYQQVLTHELAHISCRHSYDKLLIELFVVLQWFNPFVYLFRRRLSEVHEYQADYAVVRHSASPASYARLLVSQVLKLPVWGMGSSFSYSLSKKRIKMIAKVNTKRHNAYKYLVFVPVIALAVFLYACADSAVKGPELSDKFMEEAEASVNGKILASYRFEYAKGQTLEEGMLLAGGKNYAFTYKVAEGERPEVSFLTQDGSEMLPQKFTLEGSKMIAELSLSEDTYVNLVVKNNGSEGGATAMFISSLPYEKGDMKIVSITKTESDETQPQQEITGGEVFFVVENMPKFQGQDKDYFRKYIEQNLTYPKEAAKNGIQGRVFVNFIVNNKGKVEQVKVIRGVSEVLDKEALRVVKSSPDWTPGTQRGKAVNVNFTFPIVFQLN